MCRLRQLTGSFFRSRGGVDLLLSFLTRGAGAPLAFGANLLMARLVGPHNYGLYITLLSIALVCSGIASYGLAPVLTREFSAAGKESWRSVLPTTGFWALRFSLLMSVAIMILAVAWLSSGFGAPPSSWDERFLTLCIIPLSALTSLISGILSGMFKVAKSQAVSTVIRNGILLCGVAILFALDIGDVNTLLSLQAVSYAAAMLLAAIWAFRAIPQGTGGVAYLGTKWRIRDRNIPRIRVEELKRSGRHFLVISLAWLLLGRLDVVIVNAISGTTQAGYFGAAARLGQVAGAAGLIWIAWLTPRMSFNVHSAKSKGLIRLVKRGLLGSLLTTVLIVIIAWTLAPYLMGWMGTGFLPAVMPFRWLLLGYILWAACVPFYAYLAMSGKELALSRILWIQVGVTLISSLPLINSFGALGGAWAWSGGLGVGSLITGFTGIRALVNSEKKQR